MTLRDGELYAQVAFLPLPIRALRLAATVY